MHRSFLACVASLTLVLAFMGGVAVAQLQVSLNANPLDPFPANSKELIKIGEKNKPVAEAIIAFRAGNGDKVRESLLEARKVNPEFPRVDVMRARMFMANSQWADALQVLENHVALNANDAEAYKNFAEIAMVSGRWTDAWLELEKSLSLVDGMSFSTQRKQNFIAELTKLRAEVADFRQDSDLATKLFNELVKMQPKEGSPLWSLGQIKVRSGDTDAGLALMKNAKQLTPSLPQPELAVAVALASSKDRENDVKLADDWFKKSLTTKDGGISDANWIKYLQFLIDQDRAEEARALINKAPEEYKKLRDMRMLHAIILRFAGENSEAEKILSALHQENTDDLVAADHLALVLVESTDEGKRARAEQLSEANVRRAPNMERTIATAAWVKFRTGSTDIADNILGQILRGGRLEPQTAYYAAVLLNSRGMKEDYARFLKAACMSDVSFPQKRAAKKELESLEKAAKK